ncbi:Uncharacterized protein BWINRASL_02513 [Bacillus mycoides]|nr:Uncharacterized protein BWINRASL_02513 [Bacillus mycoides]
MIGLIIRNVGGNVLLLMPLGFLAPIIWDKYNKLKNTMLLGVVTSFSIEILQLIESLISGWGRITEIDDIICNVFGAIIGCYIKRKKYIILCLINGYMVILVNIAYF